MTMNTLGKQTEIIAPQVEKRVYELPPAGPTLATLIEVKDLGMKQFGDNKPKHMILLTWATDATDSHGEPFRVFERVNLNVHHMSRLASRIEAITGALPSEDEPYPVHTLLGGRALLMVKHAKTPKGTFANVREAFSVGATKAEARSQKPETTVESGDPAQVAEPTTQKANGRDVTDHTA
jgi:hypothetical protein